MPKRSLQGTVELNHYLVRLVPVVERELRDSLERRHRRRTEQALAASEERLRLILEQSPDAMTGTDLIDQIRRSRPDLKAIYTSGWRTDGHRPSPALEEGVNFISKPYRPAALVRLVRATLDATNPR